MEYFKFLPVEITLDILTRLPTEDVLECKLVCTNWRSLVRHPLFSKMHFHHLSNSDSGKLGFIAEIHQFDADSKFEYFEYNQDLELTTTSIVRIKRINFKHLIRNRAIVGSCNGLICLSFARPTHSPFCICNPITREYVLLPPIKTNLDDDIGDLYWIKGFGYVSSKNEYKVVVLIKKTEFYDVYIYTLGSRNGWRNLRNMNLGSSVTWIEVIFADEALYLVGYQSELILRFDLAEEKFCKHFSPPLPPLQDGRRWIRNIIGVLDGFLFYAVWLVVEGAGSYDVWLLRKKNGNHDILEQGELQSLVWSKECRSFRIDPRKLLTFTKTGDVLTYINHYLNICDPKASTSKRLVDFKGRILYVFSHKNTLVSLKELGEQDAKVMEAVDQP